MTSTSNYIGVSLRVSSHLRSPEEITALLGRSPVATGTKGAPRGHYLDGTPSPWKAHYWCGDFSDGDTVEERLQSIVDLLEAKRSELKAIVGDDGEAAVYVFLGLESTLGIEIEPALLTALGSMGVELGIEFSPSRGG